MAETTTDTVGSGPDIVTYDVHGDLSAATPERPALMMFGSPMDAGGFVTLRGHFTDRPVVTYDPRGSGRNPTDTTEITPQDHAADLHRVIQALDVGPVDLFASSGGAVNALALAAAHPEDIRRLVAGHVRRPDSRQLQRPAGAGSVHVRHVRRGRRQPHQPVDA